MGSESDMYFFLRVAQKRSLSDAARELNMTPSAASRRLARIEDRLGVRLLNRTTRRVSLTSEGEAYLQSAGMILAQIERMEQEITASRETPRGLLRINATFQFGREHVAPAISEFARLYPEVEVCLVLSAMPLSIVGEGFDLAIKFGKPTALGLITRLILRNRRVLVAAPAYLAKRGIPQRLTDLADHACIVLRQDQDAYDTWRFDHDSIRVTGPLSTNDGEIAVNWVLDGHGIMVRSEWDIARYVRQQSLVVVLPQVFETADVYAVYPERLNLSAKVRAFIDFFAERCKGKAAQFQLPAPD